MSRPLWYPAVDDVVEIHDDIVSEYAETTRGVQSEGDVEFALEYIETGSFGAAPETIHEKAYHLLRLLVANHPFVDGNKRTALNTTVVFYLLNGYRLEYGHEVREILKQSGTDEAATDGTTLSIISGHTPKKSTSMTWSNSGETDSFGTDSTSWPTTHQTRTNNSTEDTVDVWQRKTARTMNPNSTG
nr:type II toxin-antitoxin system death-on-curing family toxin [Haloferax sp. ATB1]